MRTILITGFGPFPRAPFNPTETLVRRLAREGRPALGGIALVIHVFRTSYAAVDRELPGLLRAHKPDALLMFGLAARTPHLRIETAARNAVAPRADIDRNAPPRRIIAPGQPGRLPLRTPAARLLSAARAARVPARLSRDAGRYVCNYLCWRAAEAGDDGPQITAFIHVPLVRRAFIPADRVKRRRLSSADLSRAARGFLRVIAAARR
jgi:pyroglutamyl-peptidase